MAMADSLMSLATAGLFAAKWSTKIEEDQYLIHQWDLDPFAATAAFKRMRARWEKPGATPEDFAQALERGGMPATAQRLRDVAELI